MAHIRHKRKPRRTKSHKANLELMRYRKAHRKQHEPVPFIVITIVPLSRAEKRSIRRAARNAGATRRVAEHMVQSVAEDRHAGR